MMEGYKNVAASAAARQAAESPHSRVNKHIKTNVLTCSVLAVSKDSSHSFTES